MEVNCDRAHEIDKKAAESIDGESFSDVQLQRKDKVITFEDKGK